MSLGSTRAAEDTDNTLQQKLIDAIYSGDLNNVKNLCAQGVDVNPDGYGSFIFKKITQQQAKDLNDGNTLAAKKIIYFLRYNSGQTVLFSLNKHSQIGSLYLPEGLYSDSPNNLKDVLNYAKEKKLIHQQLNEYDYIPLYAAICANNSINKAKIIETLIEHGADPNIEIHYNTLEYNHLLDIVIDSDFSDHYEDMVISLTKEMLTIEVDSLFSILTQKHEEYAQELGESQENSINSSYAKKIDVISTAIQMTENFKSSDGINTKPANPTAPTPASPSSSGFFAGNDGDSSMQPPDVALSEEEDAGCYPSFDCCTFM